MNKLTSKHLMLIVSMCGLIGIVLGLGVNVSGVFFSPIAEELSIGKGSVSMTATIFSLAMAFSGMVSARLITRGNFRRSIILWVGVIAVSTALIALCSSIYLMYVLQAIRGFAAGLIGMVLVTPIIGRWFYARVGLFTSICVGFSGLTGALFSPILTSLIQSTGWRTAYVITAVIMVLFALPAILFPIGMYPEDAGTQPYGIRSEQAAAQVSEPSKVPFVLFLIASCYACICCYGTAMPQHFPGIAESYQFSASVGAMMLSTAMICNTGGKVLLGILADAMGARRSNILFLAMVASGGFILLLMHGIPFMYAGAALIGCAYSLGSVGTVMIVKDLFGDGNYSKVYPRITLFTTLSNSVATALIGFLYDSTGSYTAGLLSVSVLALLSIVLLIACYSRKH